MKDTRKTSFESELIDRALEHRRAEEPPPGLEERLLARLEAERAPRAGWFLKTLAAGVPAAVVLVLVAYVLRDTPTQPPASRTPEIAAVEPGPAAPLPPAPPPPAEPAEPAAAVVVAPPVEKRAPTFPSRANLSPQEELFVRFVRNARTDTLRDVAMPLPDAPLQIDELSTPRLRVEPLPRPGPLSAS